MKNDGFTLLEVIVAMLILGIVIAGSFSLLHSNQRLLKEAKQRLQAVNQAGAVMEKLRLYVNEAPVYPEQQVGSALSIGSDGHSPAEIGLAEIPLLEMTESGTWNYLVEEVPGTNGECKRVKVSVNWEA